MDLALSSIDTVALRLGPLRIRWYALIIVAGMLIGIWLASKEAPRRHLTTDDITDFMIWAVPFSLIGVRTYYVLFEWGYYKQHPNEIIALWEGGGAIYGGLIAGTIVLLIFSYRKKINPLDLLDVAIPGVLLGQSIGRWGNFVNQEAYGAITTNLNWLPEVFRKQMFISGSYRQPTFLFESMGTLLGFIIVILLRHRIKGLLRGEIFGFYLVWYGLLRFVIEGMRTDSLMVGSVRISQLLSLGLFITGLIFILYRRFGVRKIDLYNGATLHEN